jgi:hypothetical protein
VPAVVPMVLLWASALAAAASVHFAGILARDNQTAARAGYAIRATRRTVRPANEAPNLAEILHIPSPAATATPGLALPASPAGATPAGATPAGVTPGGATPIPNRTSTVVGMPLRAPAAVAPPPPPPVPATIFSAQSAAPEDAATNPYLNDENSEDPLTRKATTGSVSPPPPSARRRETLFGLPSTPPPDGVFNAETKVDSLPPASAVPSTEGDGPETQAMNRDAEAAPVDPQRTKTQASNV